MQPVSVYWAFCTLLEAVNLNRLWNCRVKEAIINGNVLLCHQFDCFLGADTTQIARNTVQFQTSGAHDFLRESESWPCERSLLPGRKRRSNLYFWVNYYPSTKSQTQHSCQHRRFRTYQDTYSSRDWTVSRHLGLVKWWKTISTNRKSDSKRISYLDPANSHYNQSALHSGLALSAIQNHSFYLTS